MSRDRLVVLLTDPVSPNKGSGVRVLSKTAEGLAAYAAEWPGEVVGIGRPGSGVDPTVGTVVRKGEQPFEILADSPETRRRVREGAAVTLAMEKPESRDLLSRDPRRVVLVAEVPRREAARYMASQVPFADRPRIWAGWARRNRHVHAAVRAAGGLQANGYPAWNVLSKLSPNPLLFFDHRVRENVIAAEPPAVSDPSEPLRMVFSGRHIAEKGVLYAVKAVMDAQKEGVPVTLDLIGAGDQKEAGRALAASSGGRIRFHDLMSFQDEWVPWVSANADVMILPHLLGDPSGTYLEGAALGIPVLGFDNVALKELVRRHGVGWTVRLGDEAALRRKICDLEASRPEVRRAGARAVSFVRAHSFEAEYSRRVAHLREVGQV